MKEKGVLHYIYIILLGFQLCMYILKFYIPTKYEIIERKLLNFAKIKIYKIDFFFCSL